MTNDARQLEAVLAQADAHFAELPRETRVAAFAELMRRSLDQATVTEIAEAAILSLRGGAPLPALESIYDEAENWAGFAAPGERRIYCWACAKRLRPDQRAGLMKALLALDDAAA
ncbi:MAG: hypothetical protein AAF675_05545 [Pseudomonadota bacterium]